MRRKQTQIRAREGAALLAALGLMIMLSLIVGAFAFEVRLEARLVSYKKKKFKAEMLAHSGIEYARSMLAQRSKAREFEIQDMPDDPDGYMSSALRIKRGLPVESTIELGDGSFSITIKAADAARNVNLLTREEWFDILEMANVPSTEWDIMIDCLEDWIDANDNHQLNGAESDDPYYQDRGYPVRNALLDSVNELMLVKGWGEAVLFGGTLYEGDDPVFGIADLLTVWGDGRVNLNAASVDVMLSFAEYEEWELASVMDVRLGLDGQPDTLDDGIRNLEEVGADPSKFKLQSDFVKVTSVGKMFGNEYNIECVFMLRGNESTPVYWQEGLISR